MYNIKIFDISKIKEMIQALGITDFSSEKELGKLNNPTLAEVIDFVYYECLPSIPFDIIEAFSQQNKMLFFKKSIKEYLHFSIRMRLNFESSFHNGPQKSVNKMLQEHGKMIIPGIRYNDYLNEISDFYGEDYYKPIKSNGSVFYSCSEFQKEFYSDTIHSLKNNPLYSQPVESYHNIIKNYQVLSDQKQVGFDSLILDYIIESTYNIDFLKYISKQDLKWKNDTYDDDLKNILLFGLLPNVFTRNTYMDVLLPYFKSKVLPIKMVEFSASYFPILEFDHSEKLNSGRDKNKKLVSDKYSVLGGHFEQHLIDYEKKKQLDLLEECLLKLIYFVFPLMEMYTYYLVKDIFT